MSNLKSILFFFILSITNFNILLAKENKDQYYNNLTKDWRMIFPDGNRNAAGPKFFKHISDKYTKFNEFQEGSKDIYALVIDNPCAKKDFPKKVNRSYFCDGNDLDKKQISTHNGKLIIGLLYDAKYCQPSDLRKIYSNSITGRLCPIRNSTPLSEISSGMGDIFIKLAR